MVRTRWARHVGVGAPGKVFTIPALFSIFGLYAAPYPSGKGEACKAFIRRFESGRRLF